jgi:hypothetical protein
MSGILMCVAWSPMLVVIPRLPDLGSTGDVEAFWDENLRLMKFVVLAAAVGYLFLLGFLGGLLSRLRQADAEGALPWVAFASLLMFTTALNVAIGLDMAGGLLLRSANGAATYTLHSAGFILAAPAALLGTAFFVAIAALTFHTGVFPRATAWIAVVGSILNLGALGGIFTLEGPLNSGNGSVAGIAGPVGVLITWTLAVSVSWLTSDGSDRTAGPDENATNRKASGGAPTGAALTARERDG